MTTPALDDFLAWPSEDINALAAEKTVVFAPGGTSRWYFLEHGDVAQGYTRQEAFADYGRKALRRTVEIVDMMGAGTTFVVGFVPGQDERTEGYNANLRWAYELLVGEFALELYDRHNVGVMFRGGWLELFERLDAEHLNTGIDAVEWATLPDNPRRLIWLTQTPEPIPQALTPFVADYIREHGTMPPRAALCQAYYGRPITHVDVLLGHNKPSLEGLLPPMMTVGDAYFSLSPSYYMAEADWRSILYDHLYSRRTTHRDYNAMQADDLHSLRGYYQQNGHALGVGRIHQPTQTWRPVRA
jgi:hypothetical protein